MASWLRSALAAVLPALALAPACGSGENAGNGPGSAGTHGAGGTTAQCPAVPTCQTDNDPACLSIFPLCRNEKCCANYVGCVECNCDAQCPTARPWCNTGVCGECASTAHCPPERPCCEKVPFPVPITGGYYACIPVDGDRCRS